MNALLLKLANSFLTEEMIRRLFTKALTLAIRYGEKLARKTKNEADDRMVDMLKELLEDWGMTRKPSPGGHKER